MLGSLLLVGGVFSLGKPAFNSSAMDENFGESCDGTGEIWGVPREPAGVNLIAWSAAADGATGLPPEEEAAAGVFAAAGLRGEADAACCGGIGGGRPGGGGAGGGRPGGGRAGGGRGTPSVFGGG